LIVSAPLDGAPITAEPVTTFPPVGSAGAPAACAVALIINGKSESANRGAERTFERRRRLDMRTLNLERRRGSLRAQPFLCHPS
jgi:hypothetical protein